MYVPLSPHKDKGLTGLPSTCSFVLCPPQLLSLTVPAAPLVLKGTTVAVKDWEQGSFVPAGNLSLTRTSHASHNKSQRDLSLTRTGHASHNKSQRDLSLTWAGHTSHNKSRRDLSLARTGHASHNKSRRDLSLARTGHASHNKSQERPQSRSDRSCFPQQVPERPQSRSDWSYFPQQVPERQDIPHITYLVRLDWFQAPTEELKPVALLVNLHPLPIILDLCVHPVGTLLYCLGNRPARLRLGVRCNVQCH